MIKKKMYRYLGRNGILTTRILLDGINHIPMMELTAESGKVLTNGEETLYQVVVETNEVAEWQEVPDKDN